MIKHFFSLLLLFFISINNLLIYQLQYYDLKRFLKVKIHNLDKIYLIFLPFVLISFFYEDSSFILGSIILFTYLFLLYQKKKDELVTLKFTFRINRLLLFLLILNGLILIFTLKYYLIIVYILILVNPLLIQISNSLDFVNRLIINKITLNKLKNKLKNKKLMIIGITGSYGKTSTKNYLETILKLKYNVLKTSGNINTFKGVVNYLNNNLTSDINILIIEIGLDKKNGIKKFLKYFKFDYAFLTGIEKCHLATFKSIENIINEKMKLIKNAKVGFVNVDNNYLNEVTSNTYSLKDLEYLKFQNNQMIFKIKEINQEFKTNIIGDQHILNIVGVIKFLVYLKFDLNLIYQGVLRLKNEPHRYEIKKINELLVIDDAYNSNETSFKYSIDSLKYFKKRKVLITPGVIELGKENELVNYNLGVYLIDKVDEIILIGSNSLSIKKALDDNNFLNYQCFKTYQEGMNYLNKKEDKDFITLIENDLLDYYLY